MRDDTDALLDQAVAAQVAAHGVVLPPWVAYPDVEPVSAFWRMGGGEWHLMVWSHWWSQVSDEEERIAYFRMHPPPRVWVEWVAAAIWPDLNTDGAVHQLARHGIAHRFRSSDAYNRKGRPTDLDLS